MSNKLLKIGLYISELDVYGGTHKQLLKLAEYLQKSGHILTIYTPIYDKNKTYPGFEFIDVVACCSRMPDSNRFIRFAAPYYYQFLLFIKSFKNEIINSHGLGGNLFIILHKFFSPAHVFWQINDIDIAFNVGNGKDNKVRFSYLRKLFSKYTAKKVDKITVNVSKNSERVRDYLHVDAEVIYCGVDHLAPRSELPMIQGEIKIISTGVIFRYRNYEALIRACFDFQTRESRGIQLSIIGDTRYDPIYVKELNELAAALGITVHFLGAISDRAILKAYHQSHIFAFVNIDQSWGLAVFEAASAGLPVILSNSVGAAELLSYKPGMFVVDPEDSVQISLKISEILKNQDSYVTACEGALNSVGGMTWDLMYSEKIEMLFYRFAESGEKK